MLKLLLAALALLLSGCASRPGIAELPDLELSVAASESMPSPHNALWRAVGTGVSAVPGMHATYWLRMRQRAEGAEWQVYGPYHAGDVVAVREGTSDPDYISFSSDPEFLAGFSPEAPPGVSYFHIGHPPKIKHSTVHIGPLKTDVPSVTIRLPKLPDLGGGGSGGGSKPSTPTAPSPLHAGLESDVHTIPDGTQCIDPIRAFNREGVTVRISWKQHVNVSGPSSMCPGQGDSEPNVSLGPNSQERVFCGQENNAGSPCSVQTTYDQSSVRVVPVK